MVSIPTLVLLLGLASGPVGAQEPVELAVGGGLTVSGYSGYGSGGHLLGSATTYFHPAAGLRIGAVASVAGYQYFGYLPGEDPERTTPRTIDRGLQPVVGGSVALLVRWPRDGLRPYAFAGPGYFHSYWSQYTPAQHDYGWAFGVGLQTAFAGREWFVEAGGRAFGNLFYSYSDTKAVWPVSVGLRF